MFFTTPMNLCCFAGDGLSLPFCLNNCQFKCMLICSCLWIFFFLCSDKNLRLFLEGNSLLISWFLLIPPGLLLVVVFLIENTHQIYSQENLKDGKLCKFCGFIAILTLTALNGSSTTISYMTYLAVKTGKKPPTGHTIYGNLLRWILGIFTSLFTLLRLPNRLS